MKTISEEEFWELLEDNPVETGHSGSWRWGEHRYAIFEIDEKFWQADYLVHSQEGIQLFGDVELVEVKKVERVTHEWVKV